MSCTVIAVPYALAWVVGSLVATGAVGIGEFTQKVMEKAKDSIYVSDYNNFNNSCDDVEVITENHFIEKEFETPFTDKDILIKTLEEHGCFNIKAENNSISCQTGNYSLSFYKYGEQEPYKLKISCLETESSEEKVDDINSEYALNVQEDAYLQIINKLKENNMEIENEEVQEDNTIVLTINLE